MEYNNIGNIQEKTCAEKYKLTFNSRATEEHKYIDLFKYNCTTVSKPRLPIITKRMLKGKKSCNLQTSTQVCNLREQAVCYENGSNP